MIALKIISDIINGQSTVECIKFQLLNPENSEAESAELSDPVARVEFVSDFLDLLREEASIICTSVKNVEPTVGYDAQLEGKTCGGNFENKLEPPQQVSAQTVWNKQPNKKKEEKRREDKQGQAHNKQKSRNFSLEDFMPKTIPKSANKKKKGNATQVESPQKYSSLHSPPVCGHDADPITVHHLSIPDSTQLDIVNPDIQQVSSIEILTVFVDIYCILLDGGYIPNLSSELRFLLGLLLVQNRGRKIVDEEIQYSILFRNVHDCIYFATWVLSRNIHLLTVLNSSTRRLLIDNRRLQGFTQDVVKHFEKSLSEIDNNRLSPTPPGDFIAFQPDTDSRQHFPNDQSFNMFRKQRDEFYSIKSIWEKLHMMPDFSFKVSLAPKIKTIFNYGNMCNMFHLARLFRMQLVQSCFTYDEVQGIDTDVLSNGSAVDKLRLQSASTNMTTTSQITFPAHQEFFRDFIVTAATINPAFIQHLTDSIIHELLRLNEMVFTPSDIETDDDSKADEDKVVQYERCAGCAVILAKFLGLIVFLPYHSADVQIPEHILESHYNLRTSARPPVDILMCLATARQLNRLCVTVPWVVHFLVLIDEVSARIPYYCWTYRELCLIYRDLSVRDKCEKARKPWTTTMLKLVLGWLFDSHYFPQPMFWRWCIFEKAPSISQQYAAHAREGADYMNLVDRRTLYRCCPHLQDLQLPQWDVDGSIKLVTPHTTQVKEVAPSCKRHGKTEDCIIEDGLVDSFLHTQPISTSHIIDVLTEYITSCLIRHASNVLMLNAKSKAARKLDAIFSSSVANLSSLEIKKNLLFFKEQLKMASLVIGQEFVTEVRSLCVQTIPKLCSQKLYAALWSLLPTDTVQLKKLCLYIISGKCLKRFDRWCELHVNDRSVVSYLSSAINTKLRIAAKGKSEKLSCTLLPEGRKIKHKDEALSSDKTVEKLCYAIEFASDFVNMILWDIEEVVCDAVKDAAKSVQNRNDMIPSAEGIIYTLSVDLLIALVSYSPKDVSDDVLKELEKLWKCPEISLQGPPPDVLERFVSPRNVHLLFRSRDQQEEIWSTFARIIQWLVRKDFLSLDSVSCQFLSLFQHTWDNEHFMRFKQCLSNITSSQDIATSEEAGPLLSILEDYFEDFHLGDD